MTDSATCTCPSLCGDECHLGDGCRAMANVQRQSETPNFCARCGKRLTPEGVHTCTPPMRHNELREDAPWKDAVIEQLVVAHILASEHETDPRKALQDLLAYHSDIAVDPRVSSAAARLAELARTEERRLLMGENDRLRMLAATAEKWRGLATAKFGDGRTVQEIQREAAEEEREACAKLCDPAPGIKYSPNTLSAITSLAAAIRARGQK